MATIQARGVGKAYNGRTVLKALDLDMTEGELICLLGPSGCGKTTLLRIIAGFITPDSGTVVVSGRDVTALPPSQRRMGMVFQAYSLFPNMTALENVRFGPRVSATKPKAEQVKRAEDLLDLVGLSQHRAKYPHQMSGGQQQRVALARALAVEPQVLLLDEPLSALDAKVRVQLREEIRRIQRETGVTTVLVTHDQEEALSISDRVAVMNEGRLLQVATPSTIYREPADAFVARFIGAAAVLPGIAGPNGVRVGGIDLLARAAGLHAAGAAVDMFIRPEHVRLEAMNGHVPAGALAAEIRDATFFGSLTRVRLHVPGLESAPEITADLPSEYADAFRPGTKVLARWDEGAPRVMPRS